jgi:hypothetical protein
MVAMKPFARALAVGVAFAALTGCTSPAPSSSAGTPAVLVVAGGQVRACEASLLVDGGELDATSTEAVRVQIARIDRRLGIAAASTSDKPLTTLPVRWRGSPGNLKVERLNCFDELGVSVPNVSLHLENRAS